MISPFSLMTNTQALQGLYDILNTDPVCYLTAEGVEHLDKTRKLFNPTTSLDQDLLDRLVSVSDYIKRQNPEFHVYVRQMMESKEVAKLKSTEAPAKVMNIINYLWKHLYGRVCSLMP